MVPKSTHISSVRDDKVGDGKSVHIVCLGGNAATEVWLSEPTGDGSELANLQRRPHSDNICEFLAGITSGAGFREQWNLNYDHIRRRHGYLLPDVLTHPRVDYLLQHSPRLRRFENPRCQQSPIYPRITNTISKHRRHRCVRRGADLQRRVRRLIGADVRRTKFAKRFAEGGLARADTSGHGDSRAHRQGHRTEGRAADTPSRTSASSTCSRVIPSM